MSEILEVLTKGTLIVTGRLIDASNATLLAECSYEDIKVKCIYKPIAGERPLWDFPDGNLASREFAAFLISKHAGFNVVPLTILREGPFGFGMVQEWINIDTSVDLASFFSSDDARLRKMALFDAVINNTDRKIGHLLPHVDGIVYGCDHGVTFHQENKLRTVLWQWAGSAISENEEETLLSLLSEIKSNRIDNLSELITESEMRALILRIEDLLTTKSFPLPSQEWPAIPWPAF
ncbi:phosphatidylinositol kinase [Actinomycetes bacterium]|nr:phosphatidylinositol kinase [Actinomycetes bacterium]